MQTEERNDKEKKRSKEKGLNAGSSRSERASEADTKWGRRLKRKNREVDEMWERREQMIEISVSRLKEGRKTRREGEEKTRRRPRLVHPSVVIMMPSGIQKCLKL
jgi:hypothetical protein